MSYYNKHVFFCCNQRVEDKKCCNDAGASKLRDYAKQKIKALKIGGSGGVRVNLAGCLGRCKQGPVMVIYPDSIWYTYQTEADIDEIIEQHVLNGKLVERLLIAAPEHLSEKP